MLMRGCVMGSLHCREARSESQNLSEPEVPIEKKPSVVNSVVVCPDGRRIVSGSRDNTVVVWDLESGRRLTILAVDGSVESVAWQHDGQSVLAGDIGGNLYLLRYREP
jgi:WD40 repeat protein